MSLAIKSLPQVTPRPSTLALFFSLKCNYQCFFCPREHNSKYTDLPLERLEALRPAIRDADMVDITGWGEPFMYPHIAEAIRFITAENPRNCISVTTNGSHLSEDYAELVSKNLHHIVFSLNAATKATYERDMVHGRWDHVLGNIERVRRHVPGDKIIFSFVAHLENIDEFPEFVRLAARFGVKTASLTALIITKPELIRQSLWFDKDRANTAIDEARRLGEKLGVAIGARRFNGPSELPPPGAGCTSPFKEAFIGVDGSVSPCCFAGNQRMGNAYESGFDEVWYGERYQALRKERFFPECKTCFAHASLDDLSTHMAKQMGEEKYGHAPRIAVVVPVTPTTTLEDLKPSLEGVSWQTYPVVERLFALEGGREDLDPEVFALLERAGGAVLEGAGAGAQALARAAEAASGPYLALLEPGTCWHPEKLERTLKAFLSAGERCQIVGHRAHGTTRGATRTGAVVTVKAARSDPRGIWDLLAGAQPVAEGPTARVLRNRLDFRAPGVPAGPRHEWLEGVARRLNLAGEATFAAGDATEALDAFITAAEICPRYAETWSNLAIHEWAAQRHSEALNLIRRAIATDPTNLGYQASAQAMLRALPAAR